MKNNIEVPSVVDVEWTKNNFNKYGQCNKDYVYYAKRKNGDVDWIDLNSLPKKEYCGRSVIDWKACLNNKAVFKYRKDIHEVTISFHKISKNGTSLLIDINGNVVVRHSSNIQKCRFNNFFEIEYIYTEGEILDDLKILEKIRIHRTTRESSDKGYRVKCLTSGIEYEALESNLLKGYRSPYTANYGGKAWSGNSLYNTKEILPFLKNKDDAKKYTRNSREKIECVCPTCKKEKLVFIYQLTKDGFVCSTCSNKISYPERFIISLLQENDIEFETQYTYEDCKDKGLLPFDVFIPSFSSVIEMQGLQHVKDIGYMNHKRTKETDKIKKEYCRKNNINYIEIPAYNSSFNYLVEKIQDSQLDYLLDNVDLLKVKNRILKHKNFEFTEDVIELYERGYSKNRISRELNITLHYVNKVIEHYK